MLQVHPAVIAFGFANDQFRYGKSMPPSRISLRRRRSSMRSMRRTNVQWRIRRPSHCHLQGLLTLFQMWWVCPKMAYPSTFNFQASTPMSIMISMHCLNPSWWFKSYWIPILVGWIPFVARPKGWLPDGLEFHHTWLMKRGGSIASSCTAARGSARSSWGPWNSWWRCCPGILWE